MKRILSFSTLIFFLSFKSFSQIQVIQVKRNIPLSDAEPIFKDYYLSGGTKEGLRVNLVVPVTRWVNLRENNQAQDQSMKMLEPVGWLKVILAQDHLSVARLYEASNYINTPILEQPGILMGDAVSLERSFMAKSGSKLPKDSSSSQIIERENQSLQENSKSLKNNSVVINVSPQSANNNSAVVSNESTNENNLAQSPVPAEQPSINEKVNGSAEVDVTPANVMVENRERTAAAAPSYPTPKVIETSSKLPTSEDPQLLKQ